MNVLRKNATLPYPALEEVVRRYAVSVTDAVAATMHAADPETDPVARQYLPTAAELVTAPDERHDPIGDDTHSPVEGIVHRYPDRLLLMPVKTCAVYCRYCFRRENVGPGKQMLSPEELNAALDYIRAAPHVWEVILSGGDPLILSPRRLREILEALEEIPHVRVIRIHSRIPVADPSRITPELCGVLSGVKKALYLAVHVNHAQELSAAAEKALGDLHRAGCVLLSQSVLLRRVNDNPQALEDLFRRLVELRVKPYYLHHMDKASGTSHFRVSLKTGRGLLRALRGRLSGLCQPAYMLDIPGGFGKIPVGPEHLKEQGGAYRVTDPQGQEHRYSDPDS